MDKTKEAFAEYKDVVTVCEVMEMLGLGMIYFLPTLIVRIIPSRNKR